ASGDEDDRPLEGIDGCPDGLGDRGRGVVVPGDSVPFGEALQAMLDAGEGSDGRSDGGRGDAVGPAGEGGREHVLALMPARDEEVGGQYLLGRAPIPAGREIA